MSFRSVFRYELLVFKRACKDWWGFFKGPLVERITELCVLAVVFQLAGKTIAGAWQSRAILTLAAIALTAVCMLLWDLLLSPARMHSDQQAQIANHQAELRTLKEKESSPETLEKAHRQIYSIAIDVLTTLSGEKFQHTQELPQLLWYTEFTNWNRSVLLLVERSSTTGKAKAFVEPSVFSGDDHGKLKAAVKIIKMYVWASRNNHAFETIQSEYNLPTGEEACEALSKAGFSCD